MKNSIADYFIGLCNLLVQHSKVIVITSKMRDTNIALDPNVIVLNWPSKRPSRYQDFLFLSKLVKQYKPTTMISIFGFVNMFLIVGVLFRVKNRVAWIRTLSTQFPQKKIYVLRRTVIFKFATHFIANSIATKEDASRFYHINPSKIKVLPNSVRDYSEAVGSLVMNPSKLLYVGRLHSSKGIDVLIHAVNDLQKKGFDVHLDVIGEGPIKHELIELSNLLSLKDRVLFLGVKTKEEVLKAYKSSYCTIIPSRSEAFGFTVIEAMSMGTCVIGANNTGIKEIIVHNSTGLLFETDNSNDLVLKIESLLTNLTFRNCLADAGYNRFKSMYESEQAIGRDYEFFKTIE